MKEDFETLLAYAIEYQEKHGRVDKNGNRLLHLAAAAKLEDLELSDDGWNTMVSVALYLNDTSLATNNKGDTPLHCAVQSGRSAMVETLLEFNAKAAKQALQTLNNAGETPLLLAISIQDCGAIEVLLQFEPEKFIHIANPNNSYTALDYANHVKNAYINKFIHPYFNQVRAAQRSAPPPSPEKIDWTALVHFVLPEGATLNNKAGQDAVKATAKKNWFDLIAVVEAQEIKAEIPWLQIESILRIILDENSSQPLLPAEGLTDIYDSNLDGSQHPGSGSKYILTTPYTRDVAAFVQEIVPDNFISAGEMSKTQAGNTSSSPVANNNAMPSNALIKPQLLCHSNSIYAALRLTTARWEEDKQQLELLRLRHASLMAEKALAPEKVLPDATAKKEMSTEMPSVLDLDYRISLCEKNIVYKERFILFAKKATIEKFNAIINQYDDLSEIVQSLQNISSSSEDEQGTIAITLALIASVNPKTLHPTLAVWLVATRDILDKKQNGASQSEKAARLLADLIVLNTALATDIDDTKKSLQHIQASLPIERSLPSYVEKLSDLVCRYYQIATYDSEKNKVTVNDESEAIKRNIYSIIDERSQQHKKMKFS